MLAIRQAKRTEVEHKRLCKIAGTSKFTRDFSSMMFSPEAAYDKGWIRVAVNVFNGKETIIGFTCVRHKVREPKTVLYFITVEPNWRNMEVGDALMMDLEVQTPHKIIELNVAHENSKALKFYRVLGFEVLADNAINGTAWHLEKSL